MHYEDALCPLLLEHGLHVTASAIIFNIPKQLVNFVHLSSLPVAHLSDTPRRRSVVTGDSANIQDETTENSA